MKGVSQGRYTREFREEAVKLVTEEKLSLPEAARRLSLPPSTLATRVKQFRAGRLGEVGKTYRPLTDYQDLNRDGFSPDEEGTGRSKDGAGHIKKSSRVLCEGVAARYASMKELRLHYPLPLVRRVLNVSASGYYAWIDRPLSKWAREETRLEVEIRAANKRTREVCGAGSYSMTWRTTVSELVFAGSSEFGGSSAYAANRNGNSRLPPIRSIPFPSLRIS